MQKLFVFLIALCFGSSAQAQNFNQDIADVVVGVDSVLHKVYAYEQIGIKKTGSPGFDSATQWLINAYEKWGYEPHIDTFKYLQYTSNNVYIEKRAEESDEWIIIGAHYDSYGESKGANDNGSGVLATLEMARLLRFLKLDKNLRIINFGAEEDGLRGSHYYVNNVLDSEEGVYFMLNLDQLGGTKGQDNSKIVCERDEDNTPSVNNVQSWNITDTLATIMDLYTNLTPVISYAYSSDYEPFEDAGYVITGLYQESDYNQHYHSSSDLAVNMDTEATTQVIKGAIAAVLHFAQLKNTVAIEKTEIERMQLVPNPARNVLVLKSDRDEKCSVVIRNTLGQELLNHRTHTNEPIDISALPKGIYTVSIYTMQDVFLLHTKVNIVR